MHPNFLQDSCSKDTIVLAALSFPGWLFPAHLSLHSKALVVSLLHPDPLLRISAAAASKHVWVTGDLAMSSSSLSFEQKKDREAYDSPSHTSSSLNSSTSFAKPPSPPHRVGAMNIPMTNSHNNSSSDISANVNVLAPPNVPLVRGASQGIESNSNLTPLDVAINGKNSQTSVEDILPIISLSLDVEEADRDVGLDRERWNSRCTENEMNTSHFIDVDTDCMHNSVVEMSPIGTVFAVQKTGQRDLGVSNNLELLSHHQAEEGMRTSEYQDLSTTLSASAVSPGEPQIYKVGYGIRHADYLQAVDDMK